jgi:serralysin
VGLSYVGASAGISGDTQVLHTGQPLVAGGGTFQSVERFSDIALTNFNDKMVIGDQHDPATVRAWDGDDHLIGQEVSITMYGGNGNDLLVGGRADDVIYGESGNDRLLGYFGADELWGGAGSDTFYFAIDGATDRVRDFERGIDKLDVTGADANLSAAGDQAFTFIGAASFSGKAGELRVYSDNNSYVVAGDVDGDRVADLVINLGSVQVNSGDFWL